MNILKNISKELKIRESQVEKTIALLDEGNTVPFISRYRKEATGGLDDSTLRLLEERLSYLRNLEERKEEVKRLIDEQGKLTKELSEEIDDAAVLQRVEDLYKPYKKKKSTRASKAREKGLLPLAEILLQRADPETGLLKEHVPDEFSGTTPEEIAECFIDEKKDIATSEEALKGAMDIIAEMISDDPEITDSIRKHTRGSASISAEAEDPDESTVYDMYYGSAESLRKIPNHRILAINRGEKEKKLKVKITSDRDLAEALISDRVLKSSEKDSPFGQVITAAVADSYKRLISPSIEREMRTELTERAEKDAVKVFARNTEKLLMAPPVCGARIISIDPGYRTGCKVAVLDETGKLKAYTTIFPTKPKCDTVKSEETLKKLIDKYDINTIVIGNGTASRETEEFVSALLKKQDKDIRYTIVNEAGASVYSASELAAEEYPDLDVTVRGAMSLGRRLQDPLAELVKIPIKSIGVGQYQHDINQKLLEDALDNVVEDCVNRVGVELNTASASLLSRVAGINKATAKNIVSYREKHGKFRNRKELLKVPRLGEKAFVQCAGFVRISDGDEPLDNTAVHPESYRITEIILDKLEMKSSLTSIRDSRGLSGIDEKLLEKYRKKSLKAAAGCLAGEIGAGVPTVTDILAELKKPGRDPREDAPPVIFRNDVRSFEDLDVGMTLNGTVRNVVDFGAFVDIGIKNDGLVHISQMSDRYVKSPMDVVSVGDNVKVRIIDIDEKRQRVSLSMKTQ